MNSINQVFSKKCLSCGYERRVSDNYPRHRCPNCNSGYLVANTQVEKERKHTLEQIEKDEDSAKGAAEALIGLTFYFCMALIGGAFSFKNVSVGFKDDPAFLVFGSVLYILVVIPMGYWYYKKKTKIRTKRDKFMGLQK